jgi:hypothetical protein
LEIFWQDCRIDLEISHIMQVRSIVKRHIPQHWRIVYSYNELLGEIARLSSVAEIFHFLEFQIERYHEVSHHWRSVTKPIDGPLPRSRTAEFARILDCDDNYDAVVDRAYVLNHTWPRTVLPHVVCLGKSLVDLVREATDPEYAPDLTSDEANEPPDIFAFNARLIMGEKAQESTPEARLYYLESYRRFLVGLATKGRVVITNPESGIELPTEGKSQADFALDYIVEVFAPSIQEATQSMILSESEKRVTDPGIGDTRDPMIWRGSVVGLVRLLERLCQDDLIQVRQHALPSLIEKHFTDKFQNPIPATESKPHLSTRTAEDFDIEEDTIPWKGTIRLLPLVLHLLDQAKLIRLPRDPQKRSLHADVIINHFHRVDGKPFDRKGIHNSLLGAMSSQESSRIARQLVDVAKAYE